MSNFSEIDWSKSLIMAIIVLSVNCLSCKRSVPNQSNRDNTATNQLVRIDEPVCTPSRNKIIKGNVHISVDTLPEYPGGYEKFLKYVNANLKYPAGTKEVVSRVIITFVVNQDGSLSDIEVAGHRQNPLFENEALRVVKKSPKWIPGKIKGKAVRTQYTVPILFQQQQVPPSYRLPE